MDCHGAVPSVLVEAGFPAPAMVYLSEAAVATAVADHCVAKTILVSVSSAVIPVTVSDAAASSLTCACVDWPSECPQLAVAESTRNARQVRYTAPWQCRTRRACTSCTGEPNAAVARELVA